MDRSFDASTTVSIHQHQLERVQHETHRDELRWEDGTQHRQAEAKVVRVCRQQTVAASSELCAAWTAARAPDTAECDGECDQQELACSQ